MKKILLLVILAQSVALFRLERKVAGITQDMQSAIEALNDAALVAPPPPNIPFDEAMERLRNPREQ